MARIWFPFSSRLLNHPESVLIHRTTLSFPHLLPLASHRSRTQAPIDLVLRRCVPWLQDPEASSTEPGLQAALGSDDPASKSVEDGSQEDAAAAMSAGAAVGWRSGPALRPCPPLLWRGGRPVPPLPLPPRTTIE